MVCPECGLRFALGFDEQGHAGLPVCPNCGRVTHRRDRGGRVRRRPCPGPEVPLRLPPPRRWEVAVFHFPGEPTQAYVKRVVGLPGESIQIVRGDVLINGQIARKTLAEQRAMRVLVFDDDYPPADSTESPRWLFRRGGPGAGSGRTGGAKGPGSFMRRRRPWTRRTYRRRPRMDRASPGTGSSTGTAPASPPGPAGVPGPSPAGSRRSMISSPTTAASSGARTA